MGWLRDTFGRRPEARPAAAAPVPAPAPASVDWRALGNAALGGGYLAEAARCYAQGVAAHPDDPALRLNLGYVLLEQGQPQAAAERLEQALALRRPGDAFAHEAQYLLGRALAQLGRPLEALAQFDAAARAQPDFAEPVEEAVRLLGSLRRHGEAADRAQHLARLRPGAETTLLLAEQLALAGRGEAALAVLDRLCAEDPRNVEASVRRFDTLLTLGRVPQALAEAERTLALTGPHAGALANVAAALEKLGRLDEALARLEEALRVEPGHRGALVSQVALLTQQLRLPEAIAAAGEGLRLHPDDADLHWNRALAHLLQGDFAQGWHEHEWRLRVPASFHKVLQVDAPPWRGEDIAGRTLLLHGEQGFGDNIQFVRLLSAVAARAGKVVLRFDPALHPLLRGLLPANCSLLPPGAALPAVDCHAPLLSLPAILGLGLHDIPAAVPYLRADPGAVQAWRERLATGGGLKVGIAWSGNPSHANDHNRSMSLATFRALSVEGCRYFTLQPQLRESDRAVLAQWAEASDVGRDLRDFADTAALLEAMDLVVTVDTAVAHLAGALGKPVWILLPYAPDWRWMVGRDDSPWYPTARLYRQQADRAWEPVLARVQADLRARLTAPA